MSEDTTQKLPKEGSFEARVLAELAAIRVSSTTYLSLRKSVNPTLRSSFSRPL